MRWIVIGACATTLGCRASPTDWTGTWKINPSKGNYQGPIITISIAPDGEYRFDDGRSTFTFRCDGKDRQVENERNGRTRACVRSSATALDLVRKENGVRTNVGHWELSDDRKVLTVTSTTFRASGPVVAPPSIVARVSGSDDFAGEWRDTSFFSKHAEMTLKLDRQALHIGYPGVELYIDAPLDGTDAPEHGPGIPPGLTYAVRGAGKREILDLEKFNGKAFLQGSLELSRDGKTITNSWWRPDQPNNKATAVYEKK